jgi:hypothetical protein
MPEGQPNEAWPIEIFLDENSHMLGPYVVYASPGTTEQERGFRVRVNKWSQTE